MAIAAVLTVMANSSHEHARRVHKILQSDHAKDTAFLGFAAAFFALVLVALGLAMSLILLVCELRRVNAALRVQDQRNRLSLVGENSHAAILYPDWSRVH
jgi:hypothetical protein